MILSPEISRSTLTKLGIFTRVLTAFIGGFVLANIGAIIIASVLPTDAAGDKVDNIVAGMMWSFIIYLLVTLYVFATQKAHTALINIGLACAIGTGLIMIFFKS